MPNPFRHIPRVRRLASLSAKWDRREKWAIRFDHERSRRHLRRCLMDDRRILESHQTGERNQMAVGDHRARLFDRFSKAMKNASDLAVKRFKHLEGVAPCVAFVNDHV